MIYGLDDIKRIPNIYTVKIGNLKVDTKKTAILIFENFVND